LPGCLPPNYIAVVGERKEEKEKEMNYLTYLPMAVDEKYFFYHCFAHSLSTKDKSVFIFLSLFTAYQLYC
jgi:hypothetical protein